MSGLTQHYKTLELEDGASLEDIKQAYKDLAMVWHPDRFPDNARLQQKAQDKLKQINKAYEQLKAFQPTPRGRAYPPPRSPQSPQSAQNQGARRQPQQNPKPGDFSSVKRQYDPIISFQQAKAILTEYKFEFIRKFPDCCSCFESGPFCLDIREHIPEVVLSVPCKSVGTFHQLEAQELITLFHELTAEV